MLQIGITAEEVEKQLQEKAALSNKDWEGTSQSQADSWKKEDEDLDNLPFHKHPRFQQLAKENREFKAKMAEIDREKAEKIKEAKKETKIDPNMPFDEAILKIKEEAKQEAIEAMREELNKENSQTSYYESLINDWFDLLRDNGHKITQADEDKISEIALKYNIRIEQPEDLEKAFEIFDMTRKTAGAGKAKEDSNVIANRNTQTSKDTINYSNTTWSNMWERIAAKLWIKREGF